MLQIEFFSTPTRTVGATTEQRDESYCSPLCLSVPKR